MKFLRYTFAISVVTASAFGLLALMGLWFKIAVVAFNLGWGLL